MMKEFLKGYYLNNDTQYNIIYFYTLAATCTSSTSNEWALEFEFM